MPRQKFITSHISRAKRAKTLIDNSPADYSSRDKKAIVKFFLLEEIVRLYEYRLETEKKKQVETRADRMAKERNEQQFAAILTVFQLLVGIAQEGINVGNASLVGKAIPEHSLKVTANRVKYLPKLRGLAVNLLRVLSDDAIAGGVVRDLYYYDLDAPGWHEENGRRVKGLPFLQKIEESIAAAENLIPDAKREGKVRPNLNAN